MRSGDSMTGRSGDSMTRGLPLASPANMLPVQVIHREVIAPEVVSLFIVLPGTSQAPAPYLPGQFVTLALPTSRETLYRSYSLCGDGDASNPWELTIKRIQMGKVSTHFYNTVKEGTLLYSSLPRGTFTLPANLKPEMTLVMVAMGSGITPIMGMLRAMAQRPPHELPLVQLHYASRSEQEIIFGDELYDMDPDQQWLQQHHYLSSRGDRMTVQAILASVAGDGSVTRAARHALWYVCGADAFKHELQTRLKKLGVPERQVNSEVFATQNAGAAYRVKSFAEAGTGGALRIADTGATLEVSPQETLLVALERQGYHPEFSCRAGTCGACKLRVIEGQVDPIGEVLTPSERAAGYVLSCIAHPIGDVTLASGGRPPAGVARQAFAGASSSVSSRAGAVTLTRLASVLGVGALLLGSWNLTNHRPYSWDAPTAVASGSDQTGQTPAVVSPTGVQPSPVASPGAHAPTATAGAGGGVHPTPTSGSGSGGGAKPTPTATATPKPTPVCHSTPSKKCP